MLSIDGKILVENMTILTYLARLFPEKKLMPTDPAEEPLHRDDVLVLQYRPSLVPARPSAEHFADGEAAHAAVKENGKKSFWANLQEIDSMIRANGVMGREFTAVDGYALVYG